MLLRSVEFLELFKLICLFNNIFGLSKAISHGYIFLPESFNRTDCRPINFHLTLILKDLPFDHTDFSHVFDELSEGILTNNSLITNFNEFHACQVEDFNKFLFSKAYEFEYILDIGPTNHVLIKKIHKFFRTHISIRKNDAQNATLLKTARLLHNTEKTQ